MIMQVFRQKFLRQWQIQSFIQTTVLALLSLFQKKEKAHYGQVYNHYIDYNYVWFYSLCSNSLTDYNMQLSGGAPYDGSAVDAIHHNHVALVTIYSTLTTAGLVYTLICLVFNTLFRNKRFVVCSMGPWQCYPLQLCIHIIRVAQKQDGGSNQISDLHTSPGSKC